MDSASTSGDQLNISIQTDNAVTLINLGGQLTIGTTPEFSEMTDQALSGGQTGIVFDASGLTFMDSSGLSALISVLRQARGRGVAVSFAGFTGAPRRVLDLTHMGLLMDLQETVEQAKAVVSKG